MHILWDGAMRTYSSPLEQAGNSWIAAKSLLSKRGWDASQQASLYAGKLNKAFVFYLCGKNGASEGALVFTLAPLYEAG